MINNLNFSFLFFLLQIVLCRSLWFSPRMHFLCVFSSPLVCHCFTVKLLNSFIGVSTLVTFPFESHGCIRGVIYMSNVSCNISHLFYRSNSRSPPGDRSLSSSFSSVFHPRLPLSRHCGFYRRRPGGIVKARRRKIRTVSKQVLWDRNIAYALYEIVNLRCFRHKKDL